MLNAASTRLHPQFRSPEHDGVSPSRPEPAATPPKSQAGVERHPAGLPRDRYDLVEDLRPDGAPLAPEATEPRPVKWVGAALRWIGRLFAEAAAAKGIEKIIEDGAGALDGAGGRAGRTMDGAGRTL